MYLQITMYLRFQIPDNGGQADVDNVLCPLHDTMSKMPGVIDVEIVDDFTDENGNTIFFSGTESDKLGEVNKEDK